MVGFSENTGHWAWGGHQIPWMVRQSITVHHAHPHQHTYTQGQIRGVSPSTGMFWEMGGNWRIQRNVHSYVPNIMLKTTRAQDETQDLGTWRQHCHQALWFPWLLIFTTDEPAILCPKTKSFLAFLLPLTSFLGTQITITQVKHCCLEINLSTLLHYYINQLPNLWLHSLQAAIRKICFLILDRLLLFKVCKHISYSSLKILPVRGACIYTSCCGFLLCRSSNGNAGNAANSSSMS